MESRKRPRTAGYNYINSLYYNLIEGKKKDVESEIIEKKLEILIKRFEEELKTIVSDTKTTIDELKIYEESHESLLIKFETNLGKCQNIVKLDIGGKVYKVSKEVLISIKNTYFFGLLANSDKFQTQPDGSFFIDRSPRVFDKILDYFRYGKLEVQELTKLSIDMLRDDFNYYCIPLPIELQNLQWDRKSNHSCYFSNNNLTVTKSNEKTGVVKGNFAVDRFTVRINENGFFAIGFYDILDNDIADYDINDYDKPISYGWFFYVWSSMAIGIGIDKSEYYYLFDDDLNQFDNGDYLTVIREGTSIRFEKNKVDLGVCEGFKRIPNQPLFPAVVFFSDNTVCEGDSVTFVNDY